MAALVIKWVLMLLFRWVRPQDALNGCVFPGKRTSNCGLSSNLIQRAADVTIKERRKLILVSRETPLSAIYLENMLRLSRLGVVMMPPVPAFYNKPASLDDVINHHIGRILDRLDIEHDFIRRWQ